MKSSYDHWLETKLQAYIWWCEDEVCDCHQPVIEEISPNHKARYPYIIRKRLWEGTFHSEPSFEEQLDQEHELALAMERFKVTDQRP